MNPKKGATMAPMLQADLSSWLHSPRVLVSLGGLVIYCLLLSANPMVSQVYGSPVTLSLLECVYMEMCHGFNQMASLLFLIMISELPRRTAFHYWTAIRAGRARWLLSQMIYLALISLMVLVSMTLLYALLMAPRVPLHTGFTDDLLLEQGMDGAGEYIISPEIRSHFTPWTAVLWAGIPVFLFWCFMGMTVLLCSLLGHPLAGPSFFGFILMGGLNLNWEAAPSWFHLITEYSSVSAIRAHPELSEVAGVNQVFLWWGVALGLMMLLLFRIVHRLDFAKVTKV